MPYKTQAFVEKGVCVCVCVCVCVPTQTHVHNWAKFETHLFLSRSHLNHLRNFWPILKVRNDNNR